MTDQPWTKQLLRTITRKEYWERIKRSDYPPLDLATELLQERLEQMVAQSKR